MNRYERKKNIALAIHAFSAFRQALLSEGKAEMDDIRLVIAGGYDPRLAENVEHYAELQQVAERQKVSEYVSFKKNIDD